MITCGAEEAVETLYSPSRRALCVCVCLVCLSSVAGNFFFFCVCVVVFLHVEYIDME